MLITVSPYALSTYESCGEKYRLTYVEKTPRPVGPSPAAVRGRAIHRGAEVALRHVVEHQAPLPLEAAQQAALAEFERAEKGIERYEFEDGTVKETQGEKPAWDLFDEHPGPSKDAVVKVAVPAWYEHIAPTVKPAAVEKWASIELEGDGISVRLRGRLDVLPANGDLADLKSSKRSRGYRNCTPEEAAEDPQLTSYDLLYRAATGEVPRALGFDTIKMDSRKGSDEIILAGIEQPRVPPRTDEQITEHLARVESVARGIAAGVFVPARRGESWACSLKWCPFWRVCRFGEPKVAKAA